MLKQIGIEITTDKYMLKFRVCPTYIAEWQFISSENPNNNNQKQNTSIPINHFIKDFISKHKFKLEYNPTNNNVADIFTKPNSTNFKHFKNLKCSEIVWDKSISIRISNFVIKVNSLVTPLIVL